jgi:hypothetical protein
VQVAEDCTITGMPVQLQDIRALGATIVSTHACLELFWPVPTTVNTVCWAISASAGGALFDVLSQARNPCRLNRR